MYYLDSSALVKLVAKEPESGALFEFLEAKSPFVSSALARVEVLRAVARAGGSQALERRAEEVVAGIALIRIDDGILEQASRLGPPALRTLDAIHLATAMVLGGDLVALVAYDRKLLAAAGRHGIDVRTPGV